MFTTGAVYLPFFSIMTFLIAVPTGVKMFNWVFTLWRGQLMLKTPLLFALGFLTMFLIGGINGAFSASVPVDFALHDTYWVVAHLHYVLFGGSVFGIMAGFYYWFPKMTGRMMNETLGKAQFVVMFIGFNLTFFPMHELGLAGMPRRIADYSSTAGWNDLNLLATIGGFTIAASMLLVPVEHLPLAAQRRAGRRRPVGGQHARMGDQLAAAGLQLRPPPGDPVRATGLRRPARPDGRATERAATMALTTDSHAAPRRAQPARVDAARHARRHQQPGPRDAAVHHLGGDVLRRAVRGLLQHPGQRRPVAADQHRDRPRRSRSTPAILPFVGPATILLILSSFTCQYGGLGDPARRPDPVHPGDVGHGRPRHHLPADAARSTTRSLGQEGLTLSSGTYGTTYFTLTGFHGAHVFGGVIMLRVVLYRGMAGQFSAKHYDAVEAASLYWHFVDVVWILLFSLLYLLPGKTPTT